MIEFTEEELEYITYIKSRYEDHCDDGWRCDFCEPNCTCDEDYLNDLINDMIIKFPRLKEKYGEIWYRI